MSYLLFPGRHLLNTKFQEHYLWDALALPTCKKISEIIFAVTSANQSHSRYNPIPFYERAISLDRFASQFKKSGTRYSIIGIPHFNPTGRFADYTVKEIKESTEGKLSLTPDNTVVLCSTQDLILQYEKLGFTVLTIEYDPSTKKYITETPIEILKAIVKAGEGWRTDKNIKEKLSATTFETWNDFPDIPQTILRLWRDPLLTESGSLTLDRNYSAYAYGMSNDALIDFKYKDIRMAIKPGKIVDEGCADASLIVRLARDFPDSDLVGIELTTEFTARCEERLRAGEFGGTYVHFHQRNLLDKIFEDNTIDTTICNSTTHELWSYAEQEKSLRGYLQKKYDQTAPGGRLIIRDVVGPPDGEEEIYMKLSDSDGKDADILKKCPNRDSLKKHLETLSTYARFIRFAKEYLADLREQARRGPETRMSFKEEAVGGERYVILSYKNSVEFMTKKDYTDNWKSELNEEFTFWNFDEWKQALADAGFHVLENPNDKEGTSRVYTNPWVVENRYKGKVQLFKKINGCLVPVPYPPTNIVLVAEKLA
jgi:hypothetical protein